MRIGIIGTGKIGTAIAALAQAAGHRVAIGSRQSADARNIVSVGKAAAFGDIVVLAIPFHAIDALDARMLADKIVVDATNYYPARDGPVDALDRRIATTSALVAERFPRSRIVKAFNAILADDLVPQPAGRVRRALPIAGDDAPAKEVVATLYDDVGFDAVDAGSLAESWRFERAKPAYCVPLDRDGLVAALSAADRIHELPHGSWRRHHREGDPA